MRQAGPFIALLLMGTACDANVVDAVNTPPPPLPTVTTPPPDMEPPTPLPLEKSLVHRYSFDGEGTRVLDSKYAAHGDAIVAMLNGSGQLPLAGGNSGEFVKLPEKLISVLTAATFEAWLTWDDSTSPWQRIFDFGNNDYDPTNTNPNTAVRGTSYLFLTTASDERTPEFPIPALRAVYSQNGAKDEDICHGPSPFPVGVPTHVALVVDPIAEAMTLYEDGKFVVNCVMQRPLSAIDDVNNWLGRSNYRVDADLTGSYDEFRIYAAALTAKEIEDSFNAGPDAQP